MFLLCIICLCILLKEIQNGTWVTVDGVSMSIAIPNKKPRYRSEREFLHDIRGRGGTIRIHTKDFSRVLAISPETYSLGVVSCRTKKPSIRKATVSVLWGLLDVDITKRMNRYAGPNNDFYTQIGGHTRAKDIVRFPSFGHHTFLTIEWADGIVRHFLPDDIISTPGNLYPKIHM